MGTILGIILTGCAITVTVCFAILVAKLVGVWSVSKKMMDEMSDAFNEEVEGEH